jgi:tubulin--tyrosine ligase-like protein 12
MTDLETKEQEYKAFIEYHGPQLVAMGLPEPLHRRLFSKLRFNDFDINEFVQLILDEENDRMYLRATKDLKANEDVFLVDHAWTFKQRGIYQCLKENEKLRDRLDNLLKYAEKRSLGVKNPYEKQRPTLEQYLKQVEESKEPIKVYDLDEYEIADLKKIPFRPEVEEISLWDNKLNNPAEITTILMKLPNLKACWLNSNPVADNCANFNVIGDHFDHLEIFNSNLTAKASEWAMLFYARDTGAKTIEEITYLDLNGKNLLMCNDLSFMKKMVNLKTLDIGNNVDMYKPKEMLQMEAK